MAKEPWSGPTGMRHDMGYDHDGTHASTGRLLLAMADRYFLTGDKEWFQRNRLRLQAAADWIIRQRTSLHARHPQPVRTLCRRSHATLHVGRLRHPKL